jgi:hypothetical protein
MIFGRTWLRGTVISDNWRCNDGQRKKLEPNRENALQSAGLRVFRQETSREYPCGIAEGTRAELRTLPNSLFFWYLKER